MTEFAKVDVKEVKSDAPRLSFSEAEIEQLADLILESEGILRPLILKQIDIDSYVVLDGHLEYYASVRAREKNPRQGEMVNAFIISPRNEAAIQQQIQILRGSNTDTDTSTEKRLQAQSSILQVKASDWMTSFETRLSEIREELFQTKRNQEYRFNQIEKNLGEKHQGDLLDLLNALEKQDLVDQLRRYGIAKVKAEAIYNARNQKEHKKFDGYLDIVKATRGLGADGILGLIDAWSRAYRTAK